MCRDPRDPNLLTLETNALEVVGVNWHSRLDKVFIENLGKFRKYDGKSVQDLLRALRNKVCPRRPVQKPRLNLHILFAETPLSGPT